MIINITTEELNVVLRRIDRDTIEGIARTLTNDVYPQINNVQSLLQNFRDQYVLAKRVLENDTPEQVTTHNGEGVIVDQVMATEIIPEAILFTLVILATRGETENLRQQLQGNMQRAFEQILLYTTLPEEQAMVEDDEIPNTVDDPDPDYDNLYIDELEEDELEEDELEEDELEEDELEEDELEEDELEDLLVGVMQQEIQDELEEENTVIRVYDITENDPEYLKLIGPRNQAMKDLNKDPIKPMGLVKVRPTDKISRRG